MTTYTTRIWDDGMPQETFSESGFRDLIQRSNTIIYCARFSETVRFYKDILQLPVTLDNGWFIEFRLLDASYLSIADAEETSQPPSFGRGITLSLKINDLNRARETLKACGVQITGVRTVWGARVFHVTDPEGTRVEFWEH